MKAALGNVVHLPLCVQYDEGRELSRTYAAGNTYPVFILTTQGGDVIQRWTGFGGASRFIQTLRSAMSDLTSIARREARLADRPEFRDALIVAKYYADIREYQKAIDNYTLAERLRPGVDYSYNIFTNTANAVWNDKLPFARALAAADTVLAKSRRNVKNIIGTIRILTRVARKKEQTQYLEKYLDVGIAATADAADESGKRANLEFRIDKILHCDGDETRALRAKEASLGDNWQNDPQKFYPYAKWCLEREINLVKAEQYASTAADRANSGPFKAMVLQTLSAICERRGKLREAVRFMEMAVDEDPATDYYRSELDRVVEKLTAGD